MKTIIWLSAKVLTWREILHREYICHGSPYLCTLIYLLNNFWVYATLLLTMYTLLLVAIVLIAPSCLTLCIPMDCSSPGSSVHGILQARILQWVAISCSSWSSQPRDRTCVCCIPCIAGNSLPLSHRGYIYTLLYNKSVELLHLADGSPNPLRNNSPILPPHSLWQPRFYFLFLWIWLI